LGSLVESNLFWNNVVVDTNLLGTINGVDLTAVNVKEFWNKRMREETDREDNKEFYLK
jgi:hypothetical protein